MTVEVDRGHLREYLLAEYARVNEEPHPFDEFAEGMHAGRRHALVELGRYFGIEIECLGPGPAEENQ